jgi:hypothetical protein
MNFPMPEPEVVRAEVRAIMYEFYERLAELSFTLDEATALSKAARRDASITLDLDRARGRGESMPLGSGVIRAAKAIPIFGS